MSRNYQVCTRCIMDTSDPEITFDKNGVCNHCKLYDSQSQYIFSQEKLEEVVEKIKRQGKGKEYDCLIGLSGGVDSCMTAYLAKKAGLNPLALHVDNGWNSEISQSNLERTLKKLGIDLYTHVVDWEEFRDIQMAYLRASVPNVEVPTDHAINAVLFKMAARHNVSYVISGGNVMTEGIPMRGWMYDSRDLKNLRAIHSRFGKLPMKTLPRSGLSNYLWYLLVKRIKYLPLLNYLPYVKQRAKEEITRELGWRDYGGKHFESIFTRFFQAYILPRKFNMDKRKPHLSALICSGQMPREEALSLLSKSPYADAETEKNDYDYFLKKMRLSEAEFKEIMALPPKAHEDYPSNAWFFVGMRDYINGALKKFVKPDEAISVRGRL